MLKEIRNLRKTWTQFKTGKVNRAEVEDAINAVACAFKPERINVTDHMRGGVKNTTGEDDLLSHLFVEALASAVPDEALGKVLAPGQVKDEGTYLAVALFLNDLQVPVEPVLAEWEKQVDRLIEERAAQMLQDRLRDTMGALDALESRAHEVLHPSPHRRHAEALWSLLDAIAKTAHAKMSVPVTNLQRVKDLAQARENYATRGDDGTLVWKETT